MSAVRLVGKDTAHGRRPVVFLDFETIDNVEVCFLLESKFGIMTRCGLHCAPHARVTLNTFTQETVRFTFGYFNEKMDVNYVPGSIGMTGIITILPPISMTVASVVIVARNCVRKAQSI